MGVVCRQAQWHADKAVRLHSPAVETALLLKCEALLAMGKHAEALNETRSLTIQGDPMATEVLTVRAQALYLTGDCTISFASVLDCYDSVEQLNSLCTLCLGTGTATWCVCTETAASALDLSLNVMQDSAGQIDSLCTLCLVLALAQ